MSGGGGASRARFPSAPDSPSTGPRRPPRSSFRSPALRSAPPLAPEDGEQSERSHASCVPGRKNGRSGLSRARAPRPSGARDPSLLPQWPPSPPAHPAQASEHQPRPRRLSMWTGVGLRHRRASVATAAPPPLLPHRASGPPRRRRRRPRASLPSGPGSSPLSLPPFRLRLNPKLGGCRPAGPGWRCLAGLGGGRTKPLPRKAPMAEPACERLPACPPGILFGRVAPQILKKRSKFLSEPEFKTCHGKGGKCSQVMQPLWKIKLCSHPSSKQCM